VFSPETVSPPQAKPDAGVPRLPVRAPLRMRGGGRRPRVTRGAVALSLGVHALLAVLLILGIDQATRRSGERRTEAAAREQVSYLDVSQWPTEVPSGGSAAAAVAAAAATAEAERAVSGAAMDSAIARLPQQPRFPDHVPNGIPAAPAPRGGVPGAQPGAAATPGSAAGNGNAIGGDVAGGPLGAGFGDRRLIVRPEAVPERQKTDHERYMDHLGQVLGTWNDSVADEAARQHRARNWTVRDKNGREWGIGEGGVPVIAGHKIPIPLSPPIHVDRDQEEAQRAAARQTREIERQAGDTDRDRNFKERTRAIRQHQDEERRRRREGSDSNGSSSSSPPSSSPSPD
jgi:hypothetical protein